MGKLFKRTSSDDEPLDQDDEILSEDDIEALPRWNRPQNKRDIVNRLRKRGYNVTEDDIDGPGVYDRTRKNKQRF